MRNKFETNADGNYYFFPSLRSPDTAVPGNKKRQKVETLTNATVQIKNSVPNKKVCNQKHHWIYGFFCVRKQETVFLLCGITESKSLIKK